MSYNFDIAKQVLNENDKNRLMCLYLNCNPTAVCCHPSSLDYAMLTWLQINWEKAAKDFGCASVDSMKVMTRTAMKKIEKAGGKEGVEAAPATGGGKKRKAADDGNDAEAKPKKKGGRNPKKAAAELADVDAADGGDGVKEEEGGDE
ncbi:hypothetical protein LTR37_006216 [Vermiconidia calcicola]|uniref:Uncharacterized protein n=1 Tax=Vermiconidia calcicola TaxID=1690605 RepID=A0ACC3NIG8_9PEZI|nr:hypothetical protein LTR37_006216 [Vermiconidia calcicola]